MASAPEPAAARAAPLGWGGSPYWSHFSDSAAASALASVGGFVDAAGYIGLFNIFTGSITGNLVVASAAATSTRGVVPRVVVTAVFVGGAAVGNALATTMKRFHGVPARWVAMVLLSLEVLALAGSWAAGVLTSDTLLTIDSANVSFVGGLLGLSMGLQSSAVREALAGYPSTTVMTTTLVNFGSSLMHTAMLGLASGGCLALPLKDRGPGSEPPVLPSQGQELMLHQAALLKQYQAAQAALMKTTLPLVAFCAGALLGAWLQGLWGFHSLGIAIAVLLLLLLQLLLPLPLSQLPAQQPQPLSWPQPAVAVSVQPPQPQPQMTTPPQTSPQLPQEQQRLLAREAAASSSPPASGEPPSPERSSLPGVPLHTVCV